MNYCIDRQLAFVMPPKTGTTTLESFLNEWGTLKVSNNRHVFYEHALKTNPELKGFKLIGFFRDPLDRFLSVCRHAHKVRKDFSFSSFNEKEYDYYVDTFNETLENEVFVSLPQIKWLSNAEILDYKNYSKEILKLARIFNQSKIEMRRLNSTPQFNFKVSQKVVDFVQSYYADDYRLGRERGLLT